MLKTKEITIEKGRDAGRRFLITEMPVARADAWAMKALLALAGSGFNVPDPQAGMLGMIGTTLDALGKVDADTAMPLLNELLDCVQIVPDGGQPRPLNLDFNDVSDFTTLWLLRKEVFALHIDFLHSVLGPTSASAEAAAGQAT